MEGSLQGVIPILCTPFDESGEVDAESLVSLVRWLVSAGVQGIALFGWGSEMYALSENERAEILRVVHAEVSGKVKLVVGSGAPATETAVRWSREAEEGGADALMVIPPYVQKPDFVTLREYFAGVANATALPIMIQDAPFISGVTLGAPLLAQWRRDFPNLCCVKVETTPTLTKMEELRQVDGGLTLFGGLNGLYMLEEFARGSVGTMPACEFPEVCLRVHQLFNAGERAEARKLFNRYLPFIRYGLQFGISHAVHKEILRMGGIIRSSRVRGPNRQMDDSIRRDMLDCLDGAPLLALTGSDPHGSARKLGG